MAASVVESRDVPALLSVICPMFKVSRYIREFVASLIAGINDPRVTIIFVGDACPERSLELCREELSRQRSQIFFRSVFVEHDRNLGVAAARNSGLRAAQASFIGFIDPDDLIATAYFRTLLPMMESGEADIVEFGYSEFSDDHPIHVAAMATNGKHLPSSQLNPFRTGFFLWSRVYQRHLFQGLWFPEGMHYEDVRVVNEVFAKASYTLRIADMLIFYRRRSDSITGVRDRRYAEQLMNLMEGASHAMPFFKEKDAAARLIARKSLLIVLKGLKIKPAAERRLFFSACEVPLGGIRLLCREASHSWLSNWSLVLGQLVARIGRGYLASPTANGESKWTE